MAKNKKPKLKKKNKAEISELEQALKKVSSQKKENEKTNKKDKVKENQEKDSNEKKQDFQELSFQGQIKFINIDAPLLQQDNNQTPRKLENFVENAMPSSQNKEKTESPYQPENTQENSKKYSTSEQQRDYNLNPSFENNSSNNIQQRSFNVQENPEVRSIQNSEQDNLERDYISPEKFTSSDTESESSRLRKREFEARKYKP